MIVLNQAKRNAYDYVVFSMFNDWVSVRRKGSKHDVITWELRANVIMDTMPPYVRREFGKLVLEHKLERFEMTPCVPVETVTYEVM